MRNLTMLAVMLVVAAGCKAATKTQPGPDSAEAWLSSSISGQRVGYSMYRFVRNPGGYRFESVIKMTVAMAGSRQRVESRSVAQTGTDLTLRDFTFRFSSQDRSFAVRGRVVGRELRIDASGDRQERSIALEGPIYPASALGRLVATRKPAGDSTYKVPVFDAAVMDVVPAQVRVLGRERIKAGDKEYDAIKFTTRMSRIDMTTWVDDLGLAVIEASPPSIRSERTTPAEVFKSEPETARFDVLTMYRVPVETVIPAGANVARLELELTGVNPDEYDLSGPGQEVLSKNPLRVEVRTLQAPVGLKASQVVTDSEFLRPSVSIQSDAPQIIARAREIVGPEQDATVAARKLAAWVFSAVQKRATASFPNALDVLRTMKGDCNEHAVLFAALARAAGIPARTAVGLVYLDRAFYYHAWNEVYLDDWIPVDATHGEFPAGALRLKLAHGELSRQAEILGVVGTIGLRVKAFALIPAR